MGTKLDKLLMYSERFPSLNPNELDHVTIVNSRDNLKNLYFHYTTPLASKLGRVLTRKCLSRQLLFVTSVLLLHGLTKDFTCFIDCYLGRKLPVPEKFHCTPWKMLA